MEEKKKEFDVYENIILLKMGLLSFEDWRERMLEWASQQESNRTNLLALKDRGIQDTMQSNA